MRLGAEWTGHSSSTGIGVKGRLAGWEGEQHWKERGVWCARALLRPRMGLGCGQKLLTRPASFLLPQPQGRGRRPRAEVTLGGDARASVAAPAALLRLPEARAGGQARPQLRQLGRPPDSGLSSLSCARGRRRARPGLLSGIRSSLWSGSAWTRPTAAEAQRGLGFPVVQQSLLNVDCRVWT